jgi:hypothetical protein
MLWLFSNEIPNIPLIETALFQSMDIINLPNKFVEKQHLNKFDNTYLEDKRIKNKLIKDEKGLNWLINVAIKEYKKMVNKEEYFRLNQSSDETIAIITKNDYLLNFLALYTELDEYSQITNKEILSKYKAWIQKNNYKIKIGTDLQISQKIGSKLKKLYGNNLQRGKTTGNKATYKLKLKNDVEVDKGIYKINEDILAEDPYILNNLHTENKLVYNAIKNGLNTYQALELEFNDIKLIKILNELENIYLIYKQDQTSLIN